MTLISRACIALLVGLSLGLTLSFGSHFARTQDVAVDNSEARLLAEVLERVRREYVDPVDDARLMEAAIRGMVADLDPHSQFLDEREFEDIRVGATGRYSGVGLEVVLNGHDVTVIAPFENSPAARAGILPGDIIIAIDDAPVDGDELFATVQRLRGTPHTEVALSVIRKGSDTPLQFRLLREQLSVDSVQARLIAPDIGYARITHFQENTAAELRAALSALERDNLKPLSGVLLDLRNNPGGLLDAAVEVADLFLDEGIIVSARGRSDDAQFVHHARRGSVLSGAGMVVLVNGASASAAEIVAGALQDHGRAHLVGTSTFGKGLVQTVMPLSHGQAIKITTSRYFTPSGRFIQNKGITPDIVVRNPVSDANGDVQLQKALALLGHAQLVFSDAT